LYRRPELYSCLGVSHIWRQPDVFTHLRIPVFPRMASCCLLHSASFCLACGCGSDHAACGFLELSELSRRHAVLVQPLLCHLWRGGADALPGSAYPAMVIAGRCLR